MAGSLFEQLVNQISNNQARQGQNNLFVPIENNPTYPTGMRRPPIRANVQTGQLTLPIAGSNLPGTVLQPSQLEGAGVAALPWESTVAGAPSAVPPAFSPQLAIGQGTPAQVAGQMGIPRFNAATAYSQPAGPLGPIATPYGNPGGQAASNYAQGVADFARTGGGTPASRYAAGIAASPNMTQQLTSGAMNVGPAVLGSKNLGSLGQRIFNALPEGVQAKLPSMAAKVGPEAAAAAAETAAPAAAAAGAAPAAEAAASKGLLGGLLGNGVIGKVASKSALPFAVGFGSQTALNGLGINQKIAENKNLNPLEAGLRDAAQGATIGSFFGAPGAIVGGLGAGLAGGLMEAINDDPNNGGVQQVLENTVGKVPVLGDIAHAFQIGNPGQAAQNAAGASSNPNMDMLVQSGFGADANDVTRRSSTYQALTGTGIDPDIAFNVAWGDTPIGGKVSASKNTSGPFGNLNAESAALQTATQPYLDQMKASAAALGNNISGNSSLRQYAPSLVDLTNSNAASLGASAVQYPFMLDLQHSGDFYNQVMQRLASSGLRSNSTGANSSFLNALDPSLLTG